MVAPERINLLETVGRKTTVSYISFQCTSFEIRKKYICLLKIVKNSGHKLEMKILDTKNVITIILFFLFSG